MLPWTVLGAGGWLGGAVIGGLSADGFAVKGVDRRRMANWLADDSPEGPVIYAVGLTADFRERPHETLEAHTCLLSKVLQRKGVSQVCYLSSTRVYANANETHETAPLQVSPHKPEDLYNLSKLMGEALVLQDKRPGLRVVRLSNVVGNGQPATTFVGSLIHDARSGDQATIAKPSESSKDYVALDDVVKMLPKIAERADFRIYNLASGENSTHGEVARFMKACGIPVGFSATDAEPEVFAPIRVERLQDEFGIARNPIKTGQRHI